jgi:hypothetical protein
MDRAAFWKIIDTSRRQARGDVDDQLEILPELLSRLSVKEILDFDRIFTEYWVRAYTWELWAAAYIIGGGCSDDGFMDFRGWLISRGEKVYEAALADPQSLTRVVKVDDECQIEGFQYVARQVWEQKTGKDTGDFPDTGVSVPLDPTGKAWEEDDLEQHYPKLWKKYM